MTEQKDRYDSLFPSKADFDELLAFRPVFYQEGFKPVDDWGTLSKSESGALILPAPKYNSHVLEFIRVISKETWTDFGYHPNSAWRMLKNPKEVARASFGEVKSMLTYCARGERFSDGHWARMIEEGYVCRLLERLAEIQQETSRS
jgi:hypothetical protein